MDSVVEGSAVLPPCNGAATNQIMRMDSKTAAAYAARRSLIAVCILLSACAATPAGGAMPAGAAVDGHDYGAFLAARYADARSDPAAATQFYGVALAADPNNESLADQAFSAALLAGSPRAADLAKALPDNPLALMLLGDQAAAAGDFNGAVTRFQQLPEDGLSGLIRPLLLAWAQTGAGQPLAGIAGLKPLFDTIPFGPVYLLNAALIADVSNDMAEAAADYAQSGAMQAPNLRLAEILASWQARQGNAAAATAEIDQIGTDDPDLQLAMPALQARLANPVVSTPAQGMAEAYLTLAGALTQPSQLSLRITFLRFALMLRPDLSAARLLLADAQTSSGTAPGPTAPAPTDAQLRAALATLQAISPADALYGPAAMQQAGALAALNQPAAAVALLDRLAAANPGNVAPVQAAADILRGTGEFEPAIAEYDKAIAIVGKSPPPDEWTLYFDRAICEDQSGDWAAAQPDLTQALSMAPNQPYLLNYIGYSWALRGEKLAAAHAMIQQAVGLDPNDGAVIDSLGYVSLRQGNVGDAVSLLTQAVELDPDDPEVNAHLADAFFAEGRRLQADYQWRRALALKPDPRLQATIEERLKHAGPPA